MWGRGGLPVNIFCGVEIFLGGLRNFRGGLKNFRHGGGVEKFSEIFSGGGLGNFR